MKRIGCVGHDCAECKRNRRVLVAAMLYAEELASQRGFQSIKELAVYIRGWNAPPAKVKFLFACAADAAAKKRRTKP